MTATALHDKLSAAGARLAEYSGAETAAAFADPDSEFAALRSGCGLFDLGWRAKTMVAGEDRIRWLNGMVTNNIKDLPVGHGVYSFLLNPQGHILGDMNVYHRGEYLVVDTDLSQAPKLREIFEHYIIMDDVELTDASEKLSALGLEGPKSGEVLRAAGIEPGELKPLEIEDLVWREMGLSVVASATGGYEVWLGTGNTAAAWEALISAGATPVGTEALEMWRVAAGLPKYGQDIRERDLPQETEQERALSFTKGCYVGQEIVERIHSRGAVHRKFTGFSFAGGAPAPGTKIQAQGKEVGEITSVASLPAAGGRASVGLGYIRREAAAPGTTVDAGGVSATVTSLPLKLDG